METIEHLYRGLEQLNEIGAALSSERDINRLLENILLAAKTITHADGGTLYLVSEKRQYLLFTIVLTSSMGLAYGGATGKPLGGRFPDLPLYQPDGSPNDSMVAVHVALSGQTVNIADAYGVNSGFDLSGTHRFDSATGYCSRSFLTVPMKNHEGEVIGVLQLLNAMEGTEIVPFPEASQRLAESLASQAAMALTNRRLIDQMEQLFESFIRLINTAIDEKSPYTGAHCQRVPELAMLLADAASNVPTGPLAGFRLTDKDRYELRIAALLHDCGKITTPVHVVDKATKLQTLFDRIALIDTRFEILKRDAEIERLNAIAGGADAETAQRALAERLEKLEADRKFLHRINPGSERMRDEDITRVKRIANEYRWKNASGDAQAFLSDDELENLTIFVGTLTQKERAVINHHIIATIKMLEQLPWPKHLEKVPEYAGGHHERMDGKGYPRGLRREEMSIPARILGIADIFEALTASDRPYKAGMKLSQALDILETLKDSGHIDPDLFEVFKTSAVYRDYAQGRLSPQQIDF